MKLPFPPMQRGRCLLLTLFAFSLCLVLPGSRTAVQAAPASASVRLPGHIPAAAMARARALGRLPSSQTLTLSLVLPMRDPEGAKAFVGRLYDPADPLYRRYLTSDEFARRYGPTQESYDAVAAFARARGLTVAHVSPSRLLLSVSGSAAAIEAAFAVRLGRYQAANGRVFHAPNADPAIPVSLAGRLSGVIGLDDAAVRHPYYRRQGSLLSGTLKPAFKPLLSPFLLNPALGTFPEPNQIGTDPFTGLKALTPSDIKAAYNLDQTPLTGVGQTMGLYELDGYLPSDITTYNSSFGLTNIPLENVLVDGYSGVAGPNAVEVTLDIEVMNALAPGASKIIVYEAPLTNAGGIDVLQKIADDNRAKQVSISWGLGENQTDTPSLNAENASLMQMAMQGQSCFIASGDSGAYTDGATLSTADPASQPFATAVGGTTLSVTRPGGSYASETTWADPTPDTRSSFGSGGGGGISKIWPLPDYQRGVGLSTTQRNVPDVSLDADPNTGYAIYYAGQWFPVGGTSAAAPLWAAFAALANQQRVKNGQAVLGFANPLIYKIGNSENYAAGFHDIADNSTNLFYHATVGYDNATGWGSFIGSGLLPLFAPAPNTTGTAIASLTLVATAAQTPNKVVGGLQVTGTVTLVNPAPTGGATVTLTSSDVTTAPVDSPIIIAPGQTTATFTITTMATTGTTVGITAAYRGSTLTTQLEIDPAPVIIAPTTLSLYPSSVNGGDTATATVTLNGPAPTSGLIVTLSSSDPAAQVHATVTVPAGATSADSTVATSVVTRQVVATLTASAGGKSVTATLTVLAPALERIALAPQTLPGGQTATGTLTLTFPAPTGGVIVALGSDNLAAVVPATASIPAGGTTTTFSIATQAVPKTLVATITATLSGVSQKAKLEVRSARITGVSVAPTTLTGGAPAVGTVTLDSPAATPAGLVVTLAGSDPAATLPATVLVPQGAATATFPVTTTVVLAPVADTLTATLDGISKTTLLAIQPIQATNLTINPSAVIAGVPTTGTVTVNAPAPPGGLVVTLSQLGAAETLPATATVPAGATMATFPIGTPTAGTATIAVVVGGQTRTATLTVTTAVGTSFPAGLNMISTPYDYSGQSLDSLFGYTGVRLATWNSTVSQYAITPAAPADSLRLGRGYFVNLPHAVTLSHVGVPADATTDFTLPLQAGWNMIGDPFLVPVSLSALHVSSGTAVVSFSDAVSGTPLLLSSLLYSFSPTASNGSGGHGAYVSLSPTGLLQPGFGYWIYAYAPVSLVVPHPGQ